MSSRGSTHGPPLARTLRPPIFFPRGTITTTADERDAQFKKEQAKYEQQQREAQEKEKQRRKVPILFRRSLDEETILSHSWVSKAITHVAFRAKPFLRPFLYSEVF